MKVKNIVNNLSGKNISYDNLTSTSGLLPVSSTNCSAVINMNLSSLVVYGQVHLMEAEENNNKKELWKNLASKTTQLWDEISVKEEMQIQRK